jgi:midasin
MCCRPGELLQQLAQLLERASHAGIAQLLQPLLLPACAAVLQGAAQLHASAAAGGASSPETLRADQAARGAAWAYLGAVRLHLVLPPAGADPAAKHAYKREHALRVLREDIAPELEVGPPVS